MSNLRALFLIRGIPGSGKTTAARKMVVGLTEIGLSVTHFEADMFFENDGGEYMFNPKKLPEAHRWCQDQVKNSMASGVDAIIVSNTFTTNKEMKPYFELAEKWNYGMVITEPTENDVETCYNRCIHKVPRETIQRMADRWEEFNVN